MSTTHQPRSSKERFWRRMLRHWRKSGLSIRDFCAEWHVSEPSFYSWRRELQRRDCAKPLFVPVNLRTDQAPAPVANPLEVVLTSGRTIRVTSGFDAATLRQVVAVLEERSPC